MMNPLSTKNRLTPIQQRLVAQPNAATAPYSGFAMMIETWIAAMLSAVRPRITCKESKVLF